MQIGDQIKVELVCTGVNDDEGNQPTYQLAPAVDPAGGGTVVLTYDQVHGEAKVRVLLSIDGFAPIPYAQAIQLIDEMTEKIRELGYPEKHEITGTDNDVVTFTCEFEAASDAPILGSKDDAERLMEETVDELKTMVNGDVKVEVL